MIKQAYKSVLQVLLVLIILFLSYNSAPADNEKICELIISETKTKQNIKFIQIPSGPITPGKKLLEIDIDNDGKKERIIEQYEGSLAYPYLTIKLSNGEEETFSSEYIRGGGKNYEVVSYKGKNYIAAFPRDNETMYIIEYLNKKILNLRRIIEKS